MRRVSARSDTVAVIGAGTAALVEALVADGDRDVVAVDLSPIALDRLRARLDPSARVHYVIGDARTLTLDPPVAVWHDRATYHFLIDEADQRAYAAAAARSVRPGGHLVMAEFAERGPERCSGLPVSRQTPSTLQARFGDQFELVEFFEQDHVTPGGRTQRFLHAVLRRRPDS